MMYADRVLETLASGFTGTGTYSLGGAVTNARTFVAGFGTGNRCYYLARKIDWSKWEEGWGTITDGTPDTLTRTEILASFDGVSYGTSAIDWAASDTVIIYSAPIAANGGLAGWERIEETAITNAASYIKDSISSRFNWLRLRFSVRPATDADGLSVILRKGSGTDITANKRTHVTIAGDSGTHANATGSTAAYFLGGIENTSPQGLIAGHLEVFNIQSSDYKMGTYNSVRLGSSTAEADSFIGGFQCDDTAAITGIKLIFASGNIAAGRVLLEGHA